MGINKIEVQGLTIRIERVDSSNYISLTDIAKVRESSEPRFLIRSWIKNTSTQEFLSEWEGLHNKKFKRDQMNTFRIESQSNSYIPSIKKYIEATQAIGIESRSGRYGGTYAHSDIALNFMYWLSPKFQVWFIKEFQALKDSEASLLQKDWDLKRELSKANYPLLTEAVKTQLIPNQLTKKQQGIVYANEADILNVAVFGMTAKAWRIANPTAKGNIRDGAATIDLLLISNLQVIDSALIKWGCDQAQRIEILTEKAKEQRQILENNAALKRINRTLSK
ncbi:MAG: KilA-N domain-containing protein [Bacteroidota bacterium]